MSAGHSKIVLDFEFNPIKDKDIKPAARHEIIEIGAVRLDAENRTLGKFQEYIKPQYNEIAPTITKITGITDRTVENSGSFTDVLGRFRGWIGDGPVRFYSWSNTDRSVLLSEIALKLSEDSEEKIFFGRHWVDLQGVYQRIMGFEKNMGLINALGTLMISFKGREHGALADAENTAEVLKVLYDKDRIYKLKNSSAVTYNGNTHSAGGFTMGNVFAEQFAKLGK